MIRRLLRIALPVALVLAVVWFVGPRVSTEVGTDPIPIPADLDEALAWEETQWSDLTPGTEKIVRWHDPDGKARTSVAFVYLHGFTATRQEVAPLVDSLADRFGANVFYTRLAGHGRSPEAMREASVAAWTRDVRQAMVYGSLLGDRVVLVGTSTGGSLAAWAAAQPEFRAALEAVVLISPNLGPREPLSGLLDGPWGLQLARLLIGDWHTWEPANAAQRRYWSTTSAIEGLPPMMATVALARDAADTPFEAAVQVFSSTEDQVVDPARIRRWFDRIEAPEKRFESLGDVGDRHDHVLAGDILSPDGTPVLLERITDFLVGRGIALGGDPS